MNGLIQRFLDKSVSSAHSKGKYNLGTYESRDYISLIFLKHNQVGSYDFFWLLKLKIYGLNSDI